MPSRKKASNPKPKPENRNKDKTKDKKPSLKNKITEMLELPKEIVMNVPKLTMIGNTDLVVENYKGVIEYDDGRVRLNTGAGIIKIAGDRLIIKEITSEDILVSGEISSIEFTK